MVISNDDRPGVIGTVGVMLGDAGVNIADMDVGRVASSGNATMVLALTDEVPAAARRAAPRRARHPQRQDPPRLTDLGVGAQPSAARSSGPRRTAR